MIVLRLPPVTKCFVILVSVLSLYCSGYRFLQYMKNHASNAHQNNADLAPADILPQYLLLVVGKTPWWACWTLFTTNLVETKLIPFVTVIAVAIGGGRYCENIWSSRGYLIFIVAILTSSTFIETLLWPRVSELPIVISGANSLLAGIVVALRQMIPGHTLVIRKRMRLQIKWLPLLFLLLVTALQQFGLENNITAYYIGFFGSWFFLRFYQVTDAIGFGDPSDGFAFANFFPQPISTLLEQPLDRMYYIFSAKLRLVRRFTADEIEEGNKKYANRLSGTLLPTYSRGARVTNQRRRMMLQAMDQGY